MHPADLEALADLVAVRVAELMADRPSPAAAAALVSATEVARRFGVTADWVREHADELGAVRLGGGPRPRLRFDPERVAEALEHRSSCHDDKRSGAPEVPEPIGAPGPRRRRPARTSVQSGPELLPIRGRGR
jgi:hypothetical protein